MCGVFGWIKFNEPLNKDELHSARGALNTMTHRGPDACGEWCGAHVFLGHRRLRIIDLSDAANQPFWDQEKRFALIFNGELYNYVELRGELQKGGFVFRTNSDTEVLLAAFKAWGTKAFLRFDGMFAGAIHDTALNKHYLFRDHLGQKPLYYARFEDQIIYASELRALLALRECTWHLDKENFLRFLANSYYAWDTTPLAEAKKLLPGCYLEADLNNGASGLHRYWDSLPGEGTVSAGFLDAAKEFQRLFDDSCRIAMRSDVPYGVFLSGGIDSSLVLESCSAVNSDIASYCVQMGEKDFDESGKARAVGEHLQLKKTFFSLMDNNSIRDSIEHFFNFIDEPHGDPGFVNSYFLAAACKPHISVALTGDGADELFAGYLTFLALERQRLFSCLPEFCLSGLKTLAQRLLKGSDSYMGLQFKAQLFLQGFPSNEATRFPLWLAAISPEELRRLCPWQRADFFSRYGERGTLFDSFQEVLSAVSAKSPAQQLLYFYQKFFLPEFVCMHTDRAAMQSSLEARSPFLSPSLIEFANKLPDSLKFTQGELKVILRRVLQQKSFPKSIYAQDKQGFTFPLARWLKNALKEKMNTLLSALKWHDGLVDRSCLRSLMSEHLLGKRNNYRILFNLMVFRAWLDKYPQVKLD